MGQQAMGDGPGRRTVRLVPNATVARARFLMGARLAIEATGPDAVSAIEAAFEEVGRLDKVMSNWRDDSEVSALNREAASHPVKCGPHLCAVVGAALLWAEESGGAFDPTVEPLVRRLGLRGAEGRLPGVPGQADPVPPAPAATTPATTAADRWGWRHVRFDEARRLVRFDGPGIGIDLGGIGKGYALDAALGVLVSRGIETALLDFSGQILVHGRGPDDGAWTIGVTGPDDRDRPGESVRVAAGSLASSGNGERSVRGAQGPVGHILDPGAGAPAVFGGTVTVLGPDGVTADALSTALFVMGPERGATWAAAHHLDAVYLWHGAGGETKRLAIGQFDDGGGTAS